MENYYSMVSTCLLFVSEILPYISKVNGNGIIQVLSNAITTYDNDKKQKEESIEVKIQAILDEIKSLNSRLQCIENNK